MVCCYGKLPDVFFNQQIQCLRLDGHVKRGLACRRGDGNGNGNPVLCGAVLFRILFVRFAGVRLTGISRVTGIAGTTGG